MLNVFLFLLILFSLKILIKKYNAVYKNIIDESDILCIGKKEVEKNETVFATDESEKNNKINYEKKSEIEDLKIEDLETKDLEIKGLEIEDLEIEDLEVEDLETEKLENEEGYNNFLSSEEPWYENPSIRKILLKK